MNTNSTKTLCLILAILGLASLPAKADVNLVFTPVGSTTIAQGGFFDVTLSLQVTNNEQVSGLDYLFQELSAAGFYIISRSNSGSPFDDLQSPSDAMVLARPAADLNPENDFDLGASTSDLSSTSGNGTFLVSTFRIGTNPGINLGSYTISTTSGNSAASFYSGPSPDFTQNNVNQDASITITVIPEPATFSLLVMAGLSALAVTRYTKRKS